MTESFDASEIGNWSDTADAEHKLPELVRRLVLSTLPEPPSRIDMPSGSSVRLPGWDGLLETVRGNAWVPSGVSGWEFSSDKGVKSKANDDYEKRTANPLGLDQATGTFVFVTSRRWPGKRQWWRERGEEARWREVRAYDADDLVAWLGESPEVTRWFAGVIGKSPFDNEAVDRIEKRQIEARDQRSAGFADVADIKAKLNALVASTATPPDSSGSSDTEEDPELQILSQQIDTARDLIQQGLIAAARTQLRQIQREAQQLPNAIRFRLVTNLAVCALGENKFDEASSLFEEAQSIQPENRTGITNAALAALLQQNPKRASDLARKALAVDPHDSNAAAILIRALWDMEESEQLEKLVASEEWIAQESASASALAGIRAGQLRFDEAIAIYRTLIDADPDDPHAHLALSQCLLTYAQVDRLPVGYRNESLTMLREAENEARRAVDLLQPTQLNARRHEALVLRAGARALLGKVDEAMRDVDAVLVEAPEHPVAVHHKGLILLKKGVLGEARKWLESIQDPDVRADSLLPLADACLESGDAEAAIELLTGSFNLDQPAREDLGRAGCLLRAEAAIGADDSVGPILEAAIEQNPNDPSLFTLAAVRSSLRGDTESSEASLIKAIELADEPQSQALQAQLGSLYASLERFADAAELFSKACSDNACHPDAVPMLLSLFNSGQYGKALDWARKIQGSNDRHPRVVIEVEADIYGYVGDAGRAAALHGELCSREDSTPNDQVGLAMAQFRCGERDVALRTVLDIDVSDLGPDSQALMKLAHMKRFLGATDYIHDAYLSRRYGLNDPDAHLGYVSLFQGRDEDWEEPTAVRLGCAVRIKNEDDDQWWHLLEDGEEESGPRDLPPQNDLTQRLLGRSVGDVVMVGQGLGGLTYEIAEIQSRYVRAYQETLEEFSARFPDNQSLSRVKLDSDFTQIFQSIDLRHRHVSNAEALYKSQQLPFAVFCDLIGASALEAWAEYTAQPTTRFHFGTGSDQEAKQAKQLLTNADSVVLDMIALLTVHRLRLADLLRTRFPRVTIPQQVFDEIQNTIYAMKAGGTPVGHIGKDEEGRYMRTEMPENVWRERQAYALSVLELAESLERIPSYPMLDADEREQIISALTPAGAGAVYAGDDQSETRPVLISDDLVQSIVARSLGLGAVNSQALLVELLRWGVIAGEEYSARVEQLVLMNYWFVRIGADDILRRLEANGYQTTPGTQAMVRTLWGPDCTEDDAASVAVGVIASLAKQPLIPEHLELLLSSVVAAIRRGRHTNQVLLKFKGGIAARLQLAPFQSARILQSVDFYMQT